MIEPFRGFRDLICSIPGIATVTADVIVAEIGDEMSRFPTAGHLASWAGTVPGRNESAGKVKSSKTPAWPPVPARCTRDGGHVLRQHPGTYLNAKYRRIATRRGPQKANVAIQHAILVAIWDMGTSGTFYEDPGGDYFTRLNPDEHEPAPSANSNPSATPSPSPALPDPATPSAFSGTGPATPLRPVRVADGR